MSFADQVRELGGGDSDIEFLKDVDTDVSDFEGTDGPVDQNLAGDVANMWAEIQGKPKKIVFDEPKQEKKTDTAAMVAINEAKSAKKEKKQEKKNQKAEQKKLERPEKKEPKKSAAPEPVTREKPAKKGNLSSKISAIQHPGKLVIDDQDIWAVEHHQGQQPLPRDLAEVLKTKAMELLETENTLYLQKQKSDPEYHTQMEFLRSGTFGDQLGTLSLLITNSPIQNIKGLETLLGKCEIKNRESACKALEVTKDLLTSHVLPDRRLIQFKDQPLTVDASAESLIIWAYEDWLKSYFFKLLQVMERLLSDSVENIRLRSLHCLFGFFESKPEQELNLLRLGTNKLGDSSGKVASRVKKLLMDAFHAHPGIKTIAATIINENMERSKEYRFRYYAVDTLSEFILSSKDPKLANQLLYIYLNLFERLLAEWDTKGDSKEEKGPEQKKQGRKPKRGKKGGLVQKVKTASQLEDEQNARLVAKIFTGLNRAFPFSQVEASAFTKYMDTLYKMSHSPNASTYIEALSFIFQLAQAQQGQGLDRYYRALYESLLDTRLYQSSKLPKYLNLLLKSVARDQFAPRSMAFAKRLIQMGVQWPEIGGVAALCHIVNYIPNSMELVQSPENPLDEQYNIKARDPKFAKAETSKLWEILPLLNHYHPTVTLYAENLITDDKQSLDMPDIEQHTVSSFLTKWSYKKPKEKETARGGSMFQPLSGYTDLSLGVRQENKSVDEPISLQDWSTRKLQDIRPDERFYYEFFKDKPRKAKKVKSSKDDDESDAEEDAIFSAIMKSNPDELPSDDDDLDGFDDDEDLEGLKDAMGSDDDSDVNDEDLDGLEDISDDIGDSELDEALEKGSDSDAGFSDFGEFSGDDAGQDDNQEDTSEEEEAEASDTSDDKKDTKKSSKRKRGEWQDLPTFMDADQFEEFSKRSKS